MEVPFILEKGEKVLKDYSSLQYAGVAHLTLGYASGLGTTLGSSGVGGGLFSGKQVKREGSVFDAKPAHLYITNKRLVFCNAKLNIMWNRKEKSVGTPFAEIPYKVIKGLNKNSKLGNPAIDLAIVGEKGIDNIKFWLLGTEKKRGQERDEVLELIKKQIHT